MSAKCHHKTYLLTTCIGAFRTGVAWTKNLTLGNASLRKGSKNGRCVLDNVATSILCCWNFFFSIFWIMVEQYSGLSINFPVSTRLTRLDEFILTILCFLDLIVSLTYSSISELFTTDSVARIAILWGCLLAEIFPSGGSTLIIPFGSLSLSSNDGVFDARTIRSGLNFFDMLSSDWLIISKSCFLDFYWVWVAWPSKKRFHQTRPFRTFH